jgi:hypothetical protein
MGKLLMLVLLLGTREVPQSKEACTAAGGTWTEQGGRGHPSGCRVPTQDHDKACKDSAQCEGACVRGKCSAYTPYVGCGVLENGKTLCRD